MRYCLIMLMTTISAATSFAAPTYTKDIAPILWKHCAGCHRAGEVGPFSLMTYADAAKRADFLWENIEANRMPPWKAEAGFGHFRDERRLTVEEKKLFEAWVKAGHPEGDPKDLATAPKFAEGWALGEPDLILKMKENFTVPASGKDLQHCFVVPIPIPEDKFIAAVEFRPGNRKVVHHAIMYLDSTGMARLRDLADRGPGYSTFGGPGIVPTGGLGGWAPGATSPLLPDGMGKFLKKGSDLVLQIHYHPSGKPEVDQSSVGLYFTKKPVEKIVGGVALRSRNLYIPPGKKDYQVTAESEPLPTAVDAIGVFPHMHYIGKSIKAYAKTPEGSQIPLIWIKDWDFNWQGSYQFAEPVRLPKGSVIRMEALFDNSEDNPRNPSSPPKLVKWGEGTTDEMCLMGVQVVTDTREDLVKVMRMKNNQLAMLLSSGVPAKELNKKEKVDTSKGYPIPDQHQEFVAEYDKDKDGYLTEAEIAAMPNAMQKIVKDYIQKNPIR